MLAADQKPVFIKKCFNLTLDQDIELSKIASKETKYFSDILRQFIDESINNYNGRSIRIVVEEPVVAVTESPAKPDKSAVGFCQNTGCGKQVSRKKLHMFILNTDSFLFCDPCFFSGSFKELIKNLL